MRIPSILLPALIIMAISVTAQAAEPEDPFLWLEQVDSARSLGWVKAHNALTTQRFEQSDSFRQLQGQVLEVLDSPARIPYATLIGGLFYNFWRDAAHPRGLWRRTSRTAYLARQPEWETVLDLDALGAAEKENWVWKGAVCEPHGSGRCLLQLSRGGADAVVVREFDLGTKAFVKDGFQLPEAKSEVAWQGLDAIFVGTDFGAGSQTDSGYPRIVKRWQRGTLLSAAQTLLEGAASDVAVSAGVDEHGGVRHEILTRATSFYTNEYRLIENGKLVPVEVPADATITFFGPQLLVTLRSAWAPAGGTDYPAGSLLAIDFTRFRAGARDFQALFTPTQETAMDGMVATRNHLILGMLDKVKGRLYEYSLKGDQWMHRPIPAPAFGSLQLMPVAATETDESDDYFLQTVDFLTPESLYLAHAGKDERELVAQRPAFFDASGFQVEQYEAKSKDGTLVPYFIIHAKGIKTDGSNPTLLYGYGGFEVSLTPYYSPGMGKGWLEKGGVYVLANIRGGGEFGPRWHEAALKDKRQNAYDDFIAVAEDLSARGITRPQKLGIMGGSNGGLLMGVMLTERPDLFGAVVCQVPLLDMRRYNKLLAGASWMAEYGNPDVPAEWAYISRYSPYQNVRQGVHYPDVLFATSTRDDRVHPGHARKMMARMESFGVPNAWYFENTEGGHAGAADNRQTAHMTALAYTFLWDRLNAAGR